MAAAPATAGVPPGPRLPRWMQTVGFLFFNQRFVDGSRRRYGDLVTFSTLFDPQFVMVFEPELVKQLFRGSPQQLRAGEANALLGPVVGERSVLLADGAEHMRQRKLLLPPFHGERMRAYEDVMREAADRAIDGWPVGEPFALLGSMQSLTLDVIVRAVFGVTELSRQEELKRRLRGMIEPMSRRIGLIRLLLTSGRRGALAPQDFERHRREVDEMIHEEIARRRTVTDLDQREDILSMLLLARDEDDQPLSDGELRDELVTLLVAGHETTATSLAWSFELLLRHPSALTRLRAELAAGQREYLTAVIKETLRLRPVIAGVGRKVRERPFPLGGYLIPPGTEINPSIAGIHRRADRYPGPRSFRPERFLGPDPPDTYTWVPFGGGTRRCLGASFATFEMAVVIERVLARAELASADDEPEPGVRKGITFAPGRGARVIQARAPTPARAGEPTVPTAGAAASVA